MKHLSCGGESMRETGRRTEEQNKIKENKQTKQNLGKKISQPVRERELADTWTYITRA